MSGRLEIETKATCLLCFSPNCPPIVEKRGEDGDELNFDKLNVTKCGFRVLLRYLRVDFTKLSHFSTASAFHRLLVKSSQLNLSVSLCNECSSVTNDFFQLFQVFENIRIQLDLCVKQLHEFIEKGSKDEERLRKYRERMSAGNTGDLSMVQSSIAEELRSEVQKKCSLKLERSLPRIMVTKLCQNSSDIHPTEENGSQRGIRISGSTSKEPAEEKDKDSIPNPTRTTTPLPNNKSGVSRSKFFGLIAKFKARAVKNKDKNLVDFQKRMQLRSSQSQTSQCIPIANTKKDLGKQHSTSRPIQQVLADRISSSVVDAEPCSKRKPNLASEIKRRRRLKSRFAGKAKKTGGKWKCLECRKEFATFDSFSTHYGRFHSEINGLYQPRKCFECDKIFNHRGLLERHRMLNHTMNYFGGRIPPSISESRLESTLTHFVDKVQDAEWASLQNRGKTAGKCPCPFCKKGMYCTSRSKLRYHFLHSHFSDVVAHAGKQSETGSGDNERQRDHRGRLRRSGTTLTNCEHCGRTFNSTFHLRRHLISDHSYNFFKHRLPEEVSKEGLEKGLSSMMKKLEVAHGLGFTFECSVCGKGCRNRFMTRMHLLLAHFKQVVGKSVTITSTLITKSESEPVVAFEVVPGLKTEHHQRELLKVENMDEEEMAISEPFVVKVDPDRADVEMERETEAQKKSKKCEKLKKNVCAICEKVFANPKSRMEHYRRAHLRIGKRVTPGKCEFCGKMFPQKQYLLRHKLQVHPIEFLKDNLPPEVTKQQLNESMEYILADKTRLSIENDGKTKNILECPFCSTKKSEKPALKIHLLQTHLEKVVDKIGQKQSPPKVRSSLLQMMPAPGTQKCDHCEKYVASAGKCGSRRKHLILEHALILYNDRLPCGISEKEFEEALRRVQAAMRVLPKNRNDPRHFMECTLCTKKIRKHPRDSRFHVLTCHLDEVVRKVEKILEGVRLSPEPESILPD